jgi:hypothetical protein
MGQFDFEDEDFESNPNSTPSEIKPSNQYDLNDPEVEPSWKENIKDDIAFNPRKHNGRIVIFNHRKKERIILAILTNDLKQRQVFGLEGEHEMDPKAWTKIGTADSQGVLIPGSPLADVLMSPDKYLREGIELKVELRCQSCNGLLLGLRQKTDGLCTECRVKRFH